MGTQFFNFFSQIKQHFKKYLKMNDDHDDKLEVPLRVFVDEFSCPICFEWIEDCLMTPCGHVFCQKCIEECLNRSHKCPSCNHKTEPKDLVSNKHADRIVSLVQ